MKIHTRLPAYPLIAHDPFFSVWHNDERPFNNDVCHWSGAERRLRGVFFVDGVRYRFLGSHSTQPMELLESRVTPLSTQYLFEAQGVQLLVKFTSPLLPDDPEILATPVTYVQFETRFVDGKPHKVSLGLRVTADFCHSGENEPAMRQDSFTDGDLHFAYMGQAQQKPLCGSGDHSTIDWGYLFLASEDAVDAAPNLYDVLLNYSKTAEEPFTSTLLVGYDDIASINYFGRMLPGYWARNGKTITQAMQEFHARQAEILARCEQFDEALLAEAKKLGGEDYALIVTAAYRQSVAAHKLAADPDGNMVFISKENDSNGCAATVDVSYPSVPLYLLYCPELVRAMCRPILKFAKMPIWHYDFAPHDAGRYPILNGQVYAAVQRSKQQGVGTTYSPMYLYPSTVEAFNFSYQMPVEESANMLLMLAAAGHADGDYSLAAENLELLRKWCRYLLEYGEDPGDQLCTDDFAGHLAHNVNLSAKAIMGVAAFGKILNAVGETEEAEQYAQKAAQMAESWLSRAKTGDHTALSFTEGGWSLKYNLVWDKLFGFGLLPEEFYRSETASYLQHINAFGVPLDNRTACAKTDWTLWAASLAPDPEVFRALTAPIAKYIRETPSRVPFSDWYDTNTGCFNGFIARSVQGGVFMPLLMERWKK